MHSNIQISDAGIIFDADSEFQADYRGFDFLLFLGIKSESNRYNIFRIREFPYLRQKDFNSKKSFAGCIQFKNLYLLIVNVPIFGKCRIANRIANELENLI